MSLKTYYTEIWEKILITEILSINDGLKLS